MNIISAFKGEEALFLSGNQGRQGKVQLEKNWTQLTERLTGKTQFESQKGQS